MAYRKTNNRVLDLHLLALIAQGNHLAYLLLKKRYEKYSRIICKRLFESNYDSGITPPELFLVCGGCFKDVITKYDPQGVPFYSYWLDVTNQKLREYIVDNSYTAKAKAFNGVINLDDETDIKKLNLELIYENDDDYIQEKNKRELIKIIESNKEAFTHKEFVILHYVLEGYSIAELEHGNLMSRSTLYLTFKNGSSKLKELVSQVKKNNY